MTYRLDYYEPALLPGKDGDGWESGGSLPIICSSCLAITTLCENGFFYKVVRFSHDCYPKIVQSAFPKLLSLGIPLNSLGYRKMTRVLFYQHQYTKIYKTSLPMVASSHKTTPKDHLQ